MESMLIKLGRVAGIGGTLLCAVAVLTRLFGVRWIAGFETLTLMQSGIAVMTFACLCFLAAQTSDTGKRG